MTTGRLAVPRPIPASSAAVAPTRDTPSCTGRRGTRSWLRNGHSPPVAISPQRSCTGGSMKNPPGSRLAASPISATSPSIGSPHIAHSRMVTQAMAWW